MFRRRTFDQCLVELGLNLVDSDCLKAVMISKNDDGDVQITIVEGKEVSNKVKFGRIDKRTRQLIPEGRKRAESEAA